ncbi:hypothetical protein Hanom_Chr06g00525011 [Helianthus anomalus]
MCTALSLTHYNTHTHTACSSHCIFYFNSNIIFAIQLKCGLYDVRLRVIQLPHEIRSF